MRYYKKIAIWDNLRRVKLLREFREFVVAYFNNLDYSSSILEVHESEKAKQMRIELNMRLYKMHSAITLAGVNTTIYYSPPPVTGGSAVSIDLVGNIFDLCRFQIDPRNLLDIIERAIGIYTNDRRNALLRTINPLFWIDLILDYIVSLPFEVIGKIGFDQKKIESSTLGKIIKGIIYLFMLLAAIMTVWENIDDLEAFISLIQGWIE